MCGIFAVFHVEKAAELTAIGLHGLQHRAIAYAGIVSSDAYTLHRERGPGIVREVFTGDMLDRLRGMDALGHIRYPTVEDNPRWDNVQPILGRWNGLPIALAHNGNLTNVDELKELIPSERLSTSMDSELILRLLEMYSSGTLERDLIRVLKKLKGSFTFGILLPDRLVVVRDPTGNRPLSIAHVDGKSWFVSSETCAFSNVEAEYVEDVKPGTMIVIDAYGTRSIPFAEPNERKCRFEAIYYGHPASRVFGEEVGRFRMAIGRALEEHFPVPGADIVVPVPDSANFIALGFGESGRSGSFFPAILRSHYVGRTFIASTQAQRDLAVAAKFQFSADEIRDKRIVLVDDSVVRSTTLPVVVRVLRRLGAKEVHVRIGSPPIRHPCTYGINTPSLEELVMAHTTQQQLQEQVDADSLEFLPIEVLQTLSPDPDSFCYACMDGKYW